MSGIQYTICTHSRDKSMVAISMGENARARDTSVPYLLLEFRFRFEQPLVSTFDSPSFRSARPFDRSLIDQMFQLPHRL
jgi:hypothetical protein